MKSPLIFRIFKKDQIFVVKQFIDNDRIIFGNGGDVHIDLPSSDVAPIHCLVEQRGNQYYLCDLGSEQGTYKNNEAVLDEVIQSGDSFQVGPYNVFFFVGVQKSISTPPPMAAAPERPKINHEKAASVEAVVAAGIAKASNAKAKSNSAAKNKQTFAPVSQYSELSDAIRPGQGKMIEVIVSWQERIINTYHFLPKGTKTLGPKSDIVVPDGSAPKAWKFLNLKSGVVINTTPEMKVEVLRDGELTAITDASYSLNQSEAVFIKLINGMQLVVRFAPVPPPVVFESPVILGASELSGVLAALIIAVVASLVVSVNKPKPVKEEEDIERIAQVVFTRPPNPTATAQAENAAQAVLNQQQKPVEQKPPEKTPEEIKKALLLNEKKESQVSGDPAHKENKTAQDESKSHTGQTSDLKNKDPNLKTKMFTSTKTGGAVKTGAVNGANAKSKDPDPNNSGLLAAFGEGGARTKLDQVYNGSGELIGQGEKAKGVSGFNTNRAGDDLGSKVKDTGAGGNGTSTQGIAGVGTKGRSTGMTGYGSGEGLGLGDKDRVQIAAGGSEEAFTGSIDKEAVRRVVRSALAQFKSCYEREYRQNTRLEGKVVITWEIHEQGIAKNARVIKDKSTINNSNVEECVKSRMLGLKFPEPPAGTAAVVTYPFIFQGQKL